MGPKVCIKTMDRLEAELNLLRTGRYPPVIIRGLVVEDILATWRGIPTALKFFCAVDVDSGTRRVTVRSFDAQAMDSVEKALREALLGRPIVRGEQSFQFNQPPLSSAEKATLLAEVDRLVREAKSALCAAAGLSAGGATSECLAKADRLAERFRQEIVTAG